MDGYKELMRKFDKLNAAGQAKALRAGVRAGGNVVKKEARSRIPVGDKAHRTYRGNLVAPGFARRSIKVYTFVDKRKGTVYALVGVRAQAFYAVQFVELERGKSNRKGKPWLRPAFDSTTGKQVSEVGRRLKETIRRLTG